jgi:hypothetical protein
MKKERIGILGRISFFIPCTHKINMNGSESVKDVMRFLFGLAVTFIGTGLMWIGTYRFRPGFCWNESQIYLYTAIGVIATLIGLFILGKMYRKYKAGGTGHLHPPRLPEGKSLTEMLIPKKKQQAIILLILIIFFLVMISFANWFVNIMLSC